ncbi:MAG: hypothetical protein JSV12_08290 [Candidatus Bathyarchaeota archaeon]|nr:MAG: hypothetical protein JSV12_08290 [Candidatus Bathyarchaeota archaeon]
MKRIWAMVLAFLLVVGVLASGEVVASLLTTIVGGTVTVVVGDGSLWLYVNSLDLNKTDWMGIGEEPYLDAIDYHLFPDDNLVVTADKDYLEGDFDFANSGKSTETIINVTVQIYGKNSNTKTLEIHVWNSSSWTSLGEQVLSSSYGWVNYTATTVLDTWAKIDGALMYLQTPQVSGDCGTYTVDCARLQVYYNSTS